MSLFLLNLVSSNIKFAVRLCVRVNANRSAPGDLWVYQCWRFGSFFGLAGERTRLFSFNAEPKACLYSSLLQVCRDEGHNVVSLSSLMLSLHLLLWLERAIRHGWFLLWKKPFCISKNTRHYFTKIVLMTATYSIRYQTTRISRCHRIMLPDSWSSTESAHLERAHQRK